MPRKASPQPTERELAILKILWKEAPAGVRHVRDALAAIDARAGKAVPTSPDEPALTSVTTMLNIMTRKGYLKRMRQEGRYVYQPLLTQSQARGRFVQDLIDRVFNRSAGTAMVHLLETNDLSQDELRQLRSLINRQIKHKGDQP